jgi:Ribbon-helix-helix protein, copG family
VNKIKQNKRGRPATVEADRTVGVRLPGKLVGSVDAWARRADVTRSEAIRRLVERGLRVKAEPAPSAENRVARRGKAAEASNMAGRTIDSLFDDGSSTKEQKAQRKRRLIKGPAEFRDMRDRASQKRDRR